MAVFDFAPNSHVAVEKAPEDSSVVTFNGWEFTARPAVPYQRRFILKMNGMYWRLSGGALDIVTEPTTNVGTLLAFWRTHRRWKSFTYPHEYLGNLDCRFAAPVEVLEALPESGGLAPPFEITLIHHNPSYE